MCSVHGRHATANVRCDKNLECAAARYKCASPATIRATRLHRLDLHKLETLQMVARNPREGRGNRGRRSLASIPVCPGSKCCGCCARWPPDEFRFGQGGCRGACGDRNDTKTTTAITRYSTPATTVMRMLRRPPSGQLAGSDSAHQQLPLRGVFCTRPDAAPRANRRPRSGPVAAATTASPSSAGGSAVSQKYMEWAAAAGIQSPKVAQAQFGELRGAQALGDIPPNEPFITVPRAAALVVTPQQRCPSEALDAAYWKGAPWFVKMALLLLLERRKGASSAVWGYIQQLPDSIDAPVRWGEADLAQLQYQPAIAEIKQQQRQWRQYYDGYVAALRAGEAPASWEEFLWALENVRSRAFSGPYTGATFREKLSTFGLVLAAGGGYAAWAHLPLQQALNGLLAALMFNVIYDLLLSQKLKWYAMCPVVDAVNHSSSVESEVAYEYFQDAFALSTPGAGFSSGDQVFISYGAQGNDSLLQYYGFVEAGNPHDTYALEAPAPGDGTVKVVINGKGGVEAEGLAALSAAVAAGGQASEQQPEEGGAVWKAVAAACEAELSRLPTSVADDERLLQTPHLLPPRVRMAVEFRLEKKRLLERCLAKAGKKARKKMAAAKAK